jgi:hypothetical protein
MALLHCHSAVASTVQIERGPGNVRMRLTEEVDDAAAVARRVPHFESGA